MSGQRIYGLPPSQTVVTGSDGTARASWPALDAPPVVNLTVENSDGSLGAFADLLRGSVTTTGCTVRAWKTQRMNSLLIQLGASPVVPLTGATVHVNLSGANVA